MSKRSKKPSKQNLEKISRAQHRNKFFKKIEYICNLVAGNKTFSLIPPSELDKIYALRFLSPKIFAASNEKIEDSTVKYAISLISTVLKKEEVLITNKNHAITLHDYITVGLSLMLYLLGVKENAFPKVEEFCNRMIDFLPLNEGLNIANKRMLDMNQAFGNMTSDLSKQMFWLDYKIAQASEYKFSQQNLIEIHTVFPERKQLTIDGVTRPVTAVGWCFSNFGFNKLFLKPSELGIEGQFATIPLNVFIQNHAFIRLRERMDNILIGFVHLCLFYSLRFPKVIRDKREKILIEFNFFGTKAGYLVVEIIQGIILVRTFLFLTQNGTPEGDKLEEICGLGKLDKKYLAIDKLSAFMISGIGINEELNQIFKKAGCNELLLLYDKFNALLLNDTKQSTTDLMVKFLGLDSIQDSHK